MPPIVPGCISLFLSTLEKELKQERNCLEDYHLGQVLLMVMSLVVVWSNLVILCKFLLTNKEGAFSMDTGSSTLEYIPRGRNTSESANAVL